MNAEELDEQVRANDAPLKKLEQEHQKIMASVQARLDANFAAREVAREERKQKNEALWLQVTYENLCDPLMYQVISEMAWDSLGGDAKAEHIEQVLFPDTYVQKRLEWYGYGKPLMTFGVAIPKKADPEKLARTAELLTPVIKAATENDDRARFTVLEDSLSYNGSYYISWDSEDNIFILEGGNYCEYPDLLEVLKRTPTYY